MNGYHAARPNDIHEYVALLSDRLENLTRLTDIASRLMINEFPSALRSTEDTPALPKNILAEIESIARLYRDTVAMERMSQSIIPPAQFEKLHSLQIGWSQPIRDAIQKLFQFLQHICDVDYRKNTDLQFRIEMEVPSTLQEYCDELDRLGAQLPQILADQL